MNNNPSSPAPALGVAWFFLYGYLGVPASNYLPALRDLGGNFTKVYLFWQQLEPEKDRYDWTALDAFVNQLDTPEEGLVSLFSSSLWATERSAGMLPPSPAKDLREYYQLVFQMVKRAAGRVRYWQNDSEPNNPVYWASTAEKFVEQLRVFYRAVKDADPQAIVVVGGYDGLFVPPNLTPLPGQRVAPFPQQEAGLKFFHHVIREAHDSFDVFDLRLYGDAYTITARVEYFKQVLHAVGKDAPIICTEYGGPNFFEFPENRQYVPLINSWMQSIENDAFASAASPQGHATNRISALYAEMPTLAAPTQMFMQGCSAELEERYHRIQSRSLVMRNLFAFAAGVQRTLYWDLLHANGPRDDVMTLMYGKIGLLEPILNAASSDASAAFKRCPSAEVFARLTAHFAGFTRVQRHPIADEPNRFVFSIERANRPMLFVFWERRDLFMGETLPPSDFAWPWPDRAARATDLFGKMISVNVSENTLRFPLTIDPLFVEAPSAPALAAPDSTSSSSISAVTRSHELA